MAEEKETQDNPTDDTLAGSSEERIEEQRDKYGHLALLSREELEIQAKEEGIENPSLKTKEELLEALVGNA